MLNKHSTHRATIPDDGNRELTPTSYLLTSMQLNIRKHLQTELNGCPFRKSEEVTSSVGVGNKQKPTISVCFFFSAFFSFFLKTSHGSHYQAHQRFTYLCFLSAVSKGRYGKFLSQSFSKKIQNLGAIAHICNPRRLRKNCFELRSVCATQSGCPK